MAKISLTLILRLSSFGLLILLILQFSTIYNSEVFNLLNVLGIVLDLRDIFAYLFYIALFGIFMGVYFVLGFGFSMLGGFFDYNYYTNSISSSFANIVGRWFHLKGATTTAPSLPQAIDGLKQLILDIYSDWYMAILQLLVVALFFYAIRATITSNPTDSIKVITVINIILIIPIFIMGLNNVILSFGLSITYPPVIANILQISEGLVKTQFFIDIKEFSFVQFITSRIFTVALTMFIYLEFVFQLAYVQNITRPSLEREIRLSRQIDVMHSEAQKAIERIKSIEEMKREKKAEEREKRIKMSEQERKRLKDQEEQLSLSSLMSETGETTGFRYVAQLIAKKKAEKAEQKIMDAMRDTRKVANYLDKLFKQIPDAKETLTAKSAAPKSVRLVSSTLINMLIRISIITVITWICVHPYDIFVNILHSPASISHSVELVTYEGVLSLLIPFILIIPFISTIIKMAKYNKLQQILRMNELRREGLTEEEMAELEAKRAQQIAAGGGFARDQDAIADEAKKAAQRAQYS
ncbi:MAG: hypothetical protein ACTSWL_03950 [Promethearchaeota archaeon]